MRRVPTWRSTTRPASFSTLRCWETAGRLTGSSLASSPTARGCSATRSKIARRVGSPSAVSCCPSVTAYGKHRLTSSRRQAPPTGKRAAGRHPGGGARSAGSVDGRRPPPGAGSRSVLGRLAQPDRRAEHRVRDAERVDERARHRTQLGAERVDFPGDRLGARRGDAPMLLEPRPVALDDRERVKVADRLEDLLRVAVLDHLDPRDEGLEHLAVDVRAGRRNDVVLAVIEDLERVAAVADPRLEPPRGTREHVVLAPAEEAEVVVAVAEVLALLAARDEVVGQPLGDLAERGLLSHHVDRLRGDEAHGLDLVQVLELVAEA